MAAESIVHAVAPDEAVFLLLLVPNLVLVHFVFLSFVLSDYSIAQIREMSSRQFAQSFCRKKLEIGYSAETSRARAASARPNFYSLFMYDYSFSWKNEKRAERLGSLSCNAFPALR
jgi:hypothetical protein